MEQEKIWSLLGKKLSGEATMAELRELEELLQQQPELRYKAAVLSGLQQPVSNEAWEQRTDEAWERHVHRMDDEHSPEVTVEQPVAGIPRRKRMAMVIAITALMAATGSYTAYMVNGRHGHGKTQNVSLAEIHTENGVRSKTILPDGSTVWLNGGSNLQYQPGMKGANGREVMLSGEAFFEVSPDAARPFVIRSNGMTVRVLGTSFNIKAYPGDATMETSLITGALEIIPGNDPASAVRLAPNQKIIIPYVPGNNATAASYHVENIRPQEEGMISETAWRDNYLVFNNDSFSEIALKIERWYGVKVYLQDKQLKDYHFTGTFSKESYKEVLEALKATSSFRYRITGNETFISL
ncbi:MAG TPA: FecR domain-containing protein [Chitinophaga sp.]|uniref:FecR family protein n=1 Tax=Chitinophaga sp. TaxID=1869181 RepID=UPI002D104E49|nr:FecR domain-containing protein [Chitinophaga sp.]HVI43353.1 FecR domain-containing protein [Chitinophaga sp.]